ncbi:MAG TPA: endolytic transglycosylase MltG, partial [Terriglobales bacterium]
PLATDPSVIYAAMLAGRYRGTIYQSDLQFNSPYNTYHVQGLPPGPICNPGAAALQAAMHPAKTDYLYFVSDNQGHHRFARTFEDHERNVQAYRQAVNGSGK